MTGQHLASIEGVASYVVRIEFTDIQEPSTLSGNGLPFVSMETEINANTMGPLASVLRAEYGRIPYGAPLYLWESEIDGKKEMLYIGQTMLLTPQRRFEQHGSVLKILADHVNRTDTKVYYRLCSRLDLDFETDSKPVRRAIEHFPLDQARRIVDDLEAYMIYQLKPAYNTQYKNKEKAYAIPFSISSTTNIELQ